MEKRIKQIVIIGGGSAGWLTAGILAAEHRTNTETGIQITLVESPDVNTIGVGEGTWPSMRNSLQTIGISETDFIRECSATFKQGSKFVGWKNGRADDFYYHPFTIPNGYTKSNLVSAWQSRFATISFADAMCEQSHLCEAQRAPKQINTPEYAGVANYGYHLDAGKFGVILQKHCTQKLGVKHVLDHVTYINSTTDGDIESVATKNSGNIAGDLFIDCSGLSCLLIGQHFQIPFVDKKEFSINDSALAIQAPYAEESSSIASPTIATAQDAGWIWDIGLSSRRGTGHVYSSAHITDEAAEKTLRAYIANSIGEKKAEALSCKKLSIRAGHRQKFWHKNCVAVGMSAGFIEPLEASALALVEMSANMISAEMPATRDAMAVVEKRFNARFNYRWARVIDFLKLHYVLTQRTDSDYWRDASNPKCVPENLQELLTLWRHRPPYFNDFIQNEEVFPSASYQYVLYGMGFGTEQSTYPKLKNDMALSVKTIEGTLNKVSKYIAGLPSNRELIEHILKHEMIKGS
jgi:tryptophan halogenase